MTTTLVRESSPTAARQRSVTTRLTWVLVALVALALACVASVAFGARIVGWSDVVHGLAGGEDTIGQAAVAKRIPRTLFAILVGAALGVAGAVMQGVTRNPIADPGILGITSGASLAVVTGIALFGLSAPTSYTWVAIAGASVAAAFVYSIGSLGRGGATPLKLALAGAATAAAFTSLISAILLPRVDVMDVYWHWQVGGVGGATYGRIAQMLPFLALGFLVCMAASRGLNSLALGDDVAAGLGESVTRTRLLAFVGSVTLCGAATAVAGPIAFVGLIVPHVCRLLIGIDHRWLLPFAAVTGATLLTVSDVVGRVVARPEEIDVGIITAFVGAPFFIYIVRRQKVRAL